MSHNSSAKSEGKLQRSKKAPAKRAKNVSPAAAGEPVNPLESLIGYQFRQVSNTLMAELARGMESLGLKTSEASVLTVIGANPRISQSEIGRILSIKRANLVPLTAGLERRGVIVREGLDGRSHGLCLTAKGKVLCAKARALMDAHDRQIIDRLPRVTPKRVLDILGALRS